MSNLLEFAGARLARFLGRPDPRYVPLATSEPGRLAGALRPCDVLLVEGNTRLSTAIKYLTQSTWSHAALARLGHRYDMKNVLDLARFLLPVPPVPTRWRRRMLALGSGEPTKAICSTLNQPRRAA